MIVLLILIFFRNFLNIFSKRFRYINQKLLKFILRLILNFQLDYFIIIRKRSKIEVAKAKEPTNVYFAQERINKVKKKKYFYQYLRIFIFATRYIMPFDQLICPLSIKFPQQLSSHVQFAWNLPASKHACDFNTWKLLFETCYFLPNKYFYTRNVFTAWSSCREILYKFAS